MTDQKPTNRQTGREIIVFREVSNTTIKVLKEMGDAAVK